ncbi:MAG: hypothetical protein KBD01_07015 [Acidobacteria bacterium]|nr:hypothetical protein [Acidobacteriota bacterium]
MRQRLAVVCLLIAGMFVCFHALAGDEAPAGSAAAAFARIKALEGEWTGTGGHRGEAGQPGKVIYKVTGAGSAVVETMFPGTPHEMVTVYHLDGDDLVLTHYCAAGNQPHMKAKLPASGDRLDFEFVSGTNIKPDGMHMHEATMVFEGPDKLRAAWTSFQAGRPGPVAEFVLTRSKPNNP